MINDYNNSHRFFLYRINPVLKIIFIFLIYYIIFNIKVDWFTFQFSELYPVLRFLFFCFFLFLLFFCSKRVHLSWDKIFKQMWRFNFIIILSVIISLEQVKPNKDFLSFSTWVTFLQGPFLFVLLSCYFFLQKKIYKKIFFGSILFFFGLYPILVERFIDLNFFHLKPQQIFLSYLVLGKIILLWLRIFLISIVNYIITKTVSFIEINDGLQILLKPLKKIKFFVEIFSLMLSIIFMSIPFLIVETNKILKAQMARGLNFNTKNIFKKIYYLVSLLIPIFILSFNKSYVLANAMETRGYVIGNPRTKLKKYCLIRDDYFLLGVTLIILFCIYFFS